MFRFRRCRRARPACCRARHAVGLPCPPNLLGLFLLGDVGHHRDGAAARHAAAANAIPASVRRVVLEAFAGRVAQALDALGDERVGLAFAVIAVLGQKAQEIGIGAARLKQIPRRRVHFLEAVVAEDDVQIFVGIDERARHVVERDMQPGVRAVMLLITGNDLPQMCHGCLPPRTLDGCGGVAHLAARAQSQGLPAHHHKAGRFATQTRISASFDRRAVDEFAR